MWDAIRMYPKHCSASDSVENFPSDATSIIISVIFVFYMFNDKFNVLSDTLSQQLFN